MSKTCERKWLLVYQITQCNKFLENILKELCSDLNCNSHDCTYPGSLETKSESEKLQVVPKYSFTNQGQDWGD